MFNSTKGETDILDQIMRFYTTKTTCRRWHIAAFLYVRNTAYVSVSTIFVMNEDLTKEDTCKFLESFAKQMVELTVRQRSANRLQWSICQKMQLFLKDETVGIKTWETSRNKNDEQCNVFILETAGLGQKISKNDNRSLCKAVCLTRTWYVFSLFIKTNSCFSDIDLKVWWRQ